MRGMLCLYGNGGREYERPTFHISLFCQGYYAFGIVVCLEISYRYCFSCLANFTKSNMVSYAHLMFLLIFGSL